MALGRLSAAGQTTRWRTYLFAHRLCGLGGYRRFHQRFANRFLRATPPQLSIGRYRIHTDSGRQICAVFSGASPASRLYHDKTRQFRLITRALYPSLPKTIRKYNKQEPRAQRQDTLVFRVNRSRIFRALLIKAFDLTSGKETNFKTILENHRSMRLEYEAPAFLLTFCLSMLGLIVSHSATAGAYTAFWQGAQPTVP